jgi:hypothetical protein
MMAYQPLLGAAASFRPALEECRIVDLFTDSAFGVGAQWLEHEFSVRTTPSSAMPLPICTCTVPEALRVVAPKGCPAQRCA